jgi:hypothetical protein
MYELASSSALYTGGALERQFRDGMVALQHVNHSVAAFEGPAGFASASPPTCRSSDHGAP